MDRTDLVTNQTLDLKIDALRSDLRVEMSELRVEIANSSASVDRRLRGADVDDDVHDDRRSGSVGDADPGLIAAT